VETDVADNIMLCIKQHAAFAPHLHQALPQARQGARAAGTWSRSSSGGALLDPDNRAGLGSEKDIEIAGKDNVGL
jgi:hypothetical protein